MIKSLLLIVFIAMTGLASAQEPCKSDKLGSPELFGGLCVTTSVPLETADIDLLSKKIRSIQAKFPKLFARALANGYRHLAIAPSERGESGRTVLGETLKEQKELRLYADFFKADKNSSIQLKYSLAEIIIVHELLHAVDDDNSIVLSNLMKLGWDIEAKSPLEGFKAAGVEGLTNIWVSKSDIENIKNELGPLLPTLGPWKIYLEARNRVKKYGYPSIYSILGGPLESFAEIGAYAACDPDASHYIPLETLNWFHQSLLQ